MYKRTVQKNLSFVGEKLTRGRHRIHPYPAMLHPLLVNFFIEKYAQKDTLIFDPFCGSGVTLLQASINKYPSIGFDINPLALLIAKTKTGQYDKEELIKEFADFKQTILTSKKVAIPTIKNIDYWYLKSVINDLGKVRAVLMNKAYRYKDFFITSFAFVCRNQSLTRNGEFKRYRISQDKIKKTENKVFEKLFNHIEEMIQIYSSTSIPQGISNPMLASAENSIPAQIQYDLVITSPPYGDSKTTVAYGQYSSFGSEWTDDLNVYGGNDYKVDNESLGKVSFLNKDLKQHKVLMDTIEKIDAVDGKRAKEVLYFFNGYYKAVINVVNNLAPKGQICFVVGNRTVKGHQIPMDQITASFFESMGLIFEGIWVRDILNKVMPSKNSPSNIAGAKLQTMSKEYIVRFSNT